MRQVYRSVLSFFTRRRTDYQTVFGSPAGKRVFEDLCRYARMRESLLYSNDRLTVHYTGRQDMIHRIENHLALSPEELMDIYNPAHQGILIGDEQ